jgi:hypothetical protein
VRNHVIGNEAGIAVVDGPRLTLAAGNAVTHNDAAGIVVRNAPGTRLRRNTLALNGVDRLVAIRTAAS